MSSVCRVDSSEIRKSLDGCRRKSVVKKAEKECGGELYCLQLLMFRFRVEVPVHGPYETRIRRSSGIQPSCMLKKPEMVNFTIP